MSQVDMQRALAQTTHLTGNIMTSIRAAMWMTEGHPDLYEEATARVRDWADACHNISTLGYQVMILLSDPDDFARDQAKVTFSGYARAVRSTLEREAKRNLSEEIGRCINKDDFVKLSAAVTSLEQAIA